jgi:lycopene cyclase domain-containing protein
MMGHNFYLWINLGAFIFPFLLSFDRKVHYIGDFKAILTAIIAVAVPFLVWDYYFTDAQIWGFNDDYISGIHLANLPLGEVLFFIVVPYCCTFVYACCKAYFQRFDFSNFNFFLYSFLSIYGLVVLVLGWGNWYSTLVSVLALLSLGIHYIMKWNFKFFPLAFTLAMIPFLLMNGVLTGAITPEPIVWYNSDHIIGWRYYTIPIEDVLYAFVLLYWNVVIYEWRK